MFGQPAPSANVFGSTPGQTSSSTTTGIFGQNTGASVFNTASSPANNLLTTSSTTSSATPFSNLFGTSNATSTASTGLFGSQTSAASTAPSFGKNPVTSTATPLLSGLLGGSQSTVSANPSTGGFSAPTPSSTQAGGLFGAKSATIAPVSSAGSLFAPNSTQQTTSSLLTQATAAATSASTLSSLLTSTSSNQAPSLFAKSSSLPTSTAAATTTTSVAGGVPGGLTYRQLEENINKWNDDLDELERQFIAQATQINAWDRVVLENGDKITALNEELKKIKVNQDRLDHELDFISTQQKDLEALITPLEETLAGSVMTKPHDSADEQRRDTFTLAESLDCELKQMVQDLREIIESVNSNTSNEEIAAVSPFAQLERVLNVHVDSLQWVDQNLEILSKKVDQIQVPI